MGAVVVGTKDQLRIQIISKVSKGLMRAKDAPVLFNVSERTLRRWLRFYEAEGLGFLIHSNRRKVPKNKISPALRKRRGIAKARKECLRRATEKHEGMDLRRLRGPITEDAIKKRIDGALTRYHVHDYLRVEVEVAKKDEFKALTRGKPSPETRYKKITKKIPRIVIHRNVEAIADAQLMDGIFPLTTNTKEKAPEVLKIYKYQPTLEKRQSLLESAFEVAPMWLKKDAINLRPTVATI